MTLPANSEEGHTYGFTLYIYNTTDKYRYFIAKFSMEMLIIGLPLLGESGTGSSFKN